MIDELEPPPRGIIEWGRNWKDWLEKLYQYTKENTVSDRWINHAINVIGENYGDKVSVDRKNKDLIKFGRSVAVGGSPTTIEISPNANESYVTTNAIDRAVSTSASDTGVIVYEGHTIDGSGNMTFFSDEFTLTGQTAVDLSSVATAGARVTRAYAKAGTFASPASNLVGTISFYDSSVSGVSAGGVPTVNSGVHLQIAAGKNQSEKCSTTISATDYWIVTGVYADVDTKTTNSAQFFFETRDIANGGVFREAFQMTASNVSGGTFRTAAPYAIVPKNHDVRIRAISDGSVIECNAGIFGPLAKVI